MYENGIFQIWHKKSKNGKWYTAIVSVDRWGKLQFVFDEVKILLIVSMAKRKLVDMGLQINSIYEVFTLEIEFTYDIENDILKKGE